MRDARMWLSLDTSDDAWLHLIAPSGLSGLLNIGGLNDRFKGGIVGAVIRELAAHKLAEDTAIGNEQYPGYPTLTTEAELRSQCCGGLVYDARQDKNYACLQCGRKCSTTTPYVAPPAPTKAAWQPIETFPKDGEFYLARGDNYGDAVHGRHMAVVRWSKSREVCTSQYSDDFEPVDDCVYSYLTHWAELPTYPGEET